ncbi:MAG: hypothetical protein ACTHN5_08290 [Phycisphaerae bacterium]
MVEGADRACGGVEKPVENGLARLVLASFLLTFLVARVLVICIMAHKLPAALFFHVGKTHVHHLNYGIFLLSAVGGYLVFRRPCGWRMNVAAVVYGIGLGLTFDEFGMWVHLGGLYWQRASFDAVVVVGAILTLIAYVPTIRRWRPRHHVTLAAIAVALVVFGYFFKMSMGWADERLGPMLERLEEQGPG